MTLYYIITFGGKSLFVSITKTLKITQDTKVDEYEFNTDQNRVIPISSKMYSVGSSTITYKKLTLKDASEAPFPTYSDLPIAELPEKKFHPDLLPTVLTHLLALAHTTMKLPDTRSEIPILKHTFLQRYSLSGNWFPFYENIIAITDSLFPPSALIDHKVGVFASLLAGRYPGKPEQRDDRAPREIKLGTNSDCDDMAISIILHLINIHNSTKHPENPYYAYIRRNMHPKNMFITQGRANPHIAVGETAANIDLDTSNYIGHVWITIFLSGSNRKFHIEPTCPCMPFREIPPPQSTIHIMELVEEKYHPSTLYNALQSYYWYSPPNNPDIVFNTPHNAYKELERNHLIKISNPVLDNTEPRIPEPAIHYKQLCALAKSVIPDLNSIPLYNPAIHRNLKKKGSKPVLVPPYHIYYL